MIYFLPNKDRPIKFIIENTNENTMKTEKYYKSLYEIIYDELRFNYLLRRNLTRQQIHTERGKLKHGKMEEVINFLVKRGIKKEYINTEVNQERERLVFTKTINMPVSSIYDKNFGIIHI